MEEKILAYAKKLLPDERRGLSLDHGFIYAGEEKVMSLENLAMESYYSLSDSSVITAEVSTQVKKNTIATGCCFAEVEVDLKLGKIKILDIINVHDSGKLLNPKLAEMQVHGGMSMGMGYGLSEQLLLDEKSGRPLNGNLLDYKLMTALDSCMRILWNWRIRWALMGIKPLESPRLFRQLRPYETRSCMLPEWPLMRSH